MSSSHPAIQQYLKAWVAEFGRAIEMFTGEQPSLAFSGTESVSISKSAPAIWLKQVVSGEGDFQIWIGAAEPTWMELGKALGDGPPDSLRSTYLEIINQAQQGAATVTSLGLPAPLRCGTPDVGSSARFDPALFFIWDLELVDTEHPAIVIAIEQAALKVLDTAPPPPPRAEVAPVATESKKTGTTDLGRIADLSLPVSVSVGSTKLEIRNVLHARPGSVISLSKETSDLMELLVDGVIVARGELVVVKGNYGFRVKQIVTKSQRITLCSQ
jgi:flagellar motor switch protein FliN